MQLNTPYLGWTLRGAIQNHIDVYLSKDTFQEVKRAFPYLVAKEYATGGGDVSTFFSLCHACFTCGSTHSNRCPYFGTISLRMGSLLKSVIF